jgi:hypothetical protein
MAPPFLTTTADITAVTKMVRDYNVIIQDKNAVSDSQMVDFLNKHAFPRIRGRLLTATDSTNTHVFYADISKLADPVVAAAADNLVFQVMTDSIVKDYVWRIGAQLAASWATNMLVGQLQPQQDIAREYEKQAMADLKELVNSPELISAVAQAKAKLESQTLDEAPRIFIALDIDPTTYTPADNTAKTFTGAQEIGTARLWLGPWNISAAVVIGDTPAVIMNKLLVALRVLQTAPVPGMNYNIVIGPNEGAPTVQPRYMTFTPLIGPSTQVLPSVSTNVGWLAFHAYQHDPLVDGVFVTLELLNNTGALGISGLVYGVNSAPVYSLLSNKGPYSVFIDVSQGKGVTATTTATQALTDLSDTFYFNIPNNGGILINDGIVRYQIQNLVGAPNPTAPMPVDVPVTAGMNALDVVLAIARSVEKTGPQQRVLSAVRSPTTIAIGGTPITAPGLRMVAYRPTNFESKIVFDMLAVPTELEFGVVPQSLAAPIGSFDNKPKSLVLAAQFTLGATGTNTNTPLTTTTGSVRAVQPTLSDRLTNAFTDINYINRMI